jgi:hypothetical protein
VAGAADAVDCLIFGVVSKPALGAGDGPFIAASITTSRFLKQCPRLLRALAVPEVRGGQVLKKTQDEEIIERVAGLDIGKAELVCCVRVPDGERCREADVGGRDLFHDDTVPCWGWLTGWLAWGVTRVVTEDVGVLEADVLPAGGCRGSRRGWSTPRSSSACPASPPFPGLGGPAQARHPQRVQAQRMGQSAADSGLPQRRCFPSAVWTRTPRPSSPLSPRPSP